MKGVKRPPPQSQCAAMIILWILTMALSRTIAEDGTRNEVLRPDMIWNATKRRVRGNVTWESGSVILVTGDQKLEITEGSSLTVRPGARILFGSTESGILNNGLMRLLGANSDDSFVTLEPGFRLPDGSLGQWSGISFGSTAVSGSSESVTSGISPRYVEGSLFQWTRISGILGGINGALHCPNGHAPYMNNVTLDDIRGRAINIFNLQEQLVMRNVTVHRREGTPNQRSDIRIRGGRYRQPGRRARYILRTGSLWVDGLRVAGSRSVDDTKVPPPFALSVAGLKAGAVVRKSHLESGGSGLQIFECTRPATIQRNTLVAADGGGVHLAMRRVGKPVDFQDRRPKNVLVDNEIRGGAMRLEDVHAIRIERNKIRRGGPVSVRNFRDSQVVIRLNQWKRLGEDSTAPLFALGSSLGSFLFAHNDIQDCEAAGDLFFFAPSSSNATKLDFRKNTVTNCTGERSLLRVHDVAWHVRRNCFEKVVAPISVDVSGIRSTTTTTLSTAPRMYGNISDNYWGSVFSDDIVSGRRQTVLDTLTSTTTLGTVVDFGTVLTEPVKSKVKKERVSLGIGSLVHSDGTLGGIVLKGTHVIDTDSLDGPSVVNLNLIVAGNAQLRIIGGTKRNSRLQFQKNIGILLLDKGNLSIEGTRSGKDGDGYLELEPFDDDVKWGQVLLHSTSNVSISGVHMREFGGILHRGTGSLTVSNSWVEGSLPADRFSRQQDECLWSSTANANMGSSVEISNSTFSKCYGGIFFLNRRKVRISKSSLSFLGEFGIHVVRLGGTVEIVDSFVESFDRSDYTDFSSILEITRGFETANELIVRNTTFNSNTSTGIQISTCFSNIYLENNTITFQNYAIQYGFDVSECAVDTVAIRNNTIRDSISKAEFGDPPAIFVVYEPEFPPNDDSRRKGEGLVIADNSFHNVTFGQMIRADIKDARGTSVQVTGNFVDSDCVATSSVPAFISLAPWNCPGTTNDAAAITCTAKGNTFMDRQAQETNDPFYFLLVGFGEFVDSGDAVIDATDGYWGGRTDILDRILVLDGSAVPIEAQDVVRYLPYRLSPDRDGELFPSCANDNPCSNHGVCTDKLSCECWSEWEGPFCNVPVVIANGN